MRRAPAYQQSWLDDGSGVNANIFIDGYILSATTGKNELASVVSTGKRVSAVGVVYAHPEGTSDEAVTCLRVRNCDEIVEVTSGETPDDTETPGNTETPDTEMPGTDSSDSGNDSTDGTGNGGSVSGNVTVSDGQTTDAVTVASQNDWDSVTKQSDSGIRRQHSHGSPCRRCFCAGRCHCGSARKGCTSGIQAGKRNRVDN